MFSPGILGGDESHQALEVVRSSYAQNVIPLQPRLGLLCAAWEGRPSALALHGAGVPLMCQGDELVDLPDVWKAMLDDDGMRPALAASVHIGAGASLPQTAQDQLATRLGPWYGPWRRLMVFSGWCERLHASHIQQVTPSDDERIDEWLGLVVEAEGLLTAVSPRQG